MSKGGSVQTSAHSQWRRQYRWLASFASRAEAWSYFCDTPPGSLIVYYEGPPNYETFDVLTLAAEPGA